MDTSLFAIVNGLGIVVTLVLTVITVVAMRKPRRATVPAALVSALLSLATWGVFVALSGARLSSAIGIAALVAGACVGLIRGLTTRLTYHDGHVWTETRGCTAVLWGGSLLTAQVLVTLGSVLWAAVGLIPLYVSTSSEVVYQGVLLVKRLFYKPPLPQSA